MKIAFFLDDFPSISQTFILSQINGVIDQGHQVDIYARRKTNINVKHNALMVHNLPNRTTYLEAMPHNRIHRIILASKSFFVHSCWQHPKLLLKSINLKSYRPMLKLFFSALPFFRIGPKQYDVIHCQFGHIGPIVIDLIEIGALKGELITSFRGHDIAQKSSRVHGDYSKLFAKGRLFLPVSKSLMALLVENGCPQNKISVLHSGIDCNKFQFKERSLAPEEKIKIISTARLVEKKGITYAIDAIGELIQKGLNLEYKIIGDGPLKKELESQANDLGLSNAVQFLGWRTHDEVQQELNEAHIFLAPSVTAKSGDKEGIPNAIKEAMAQGMPIISTTHSGIPELVEDGISGYLAPERNVIALAEKIEECCRNSSNWKEMGHAGRKKVMEEFDIAELNKKLVNLYKEAVQRS